MRKIGLILVIMTGLLACQSGEEIKDNNGSTNGADLDMNDDVAKLSYSLGVNLGNSFAQQGLKELNFDVFASAVKDVLENNKLKISADSANLIIRDYMTAGAKKEGADFLVKNKERSEVKETASGLQYEVLVESKGPKPNLESKIKTHYHGTLIDGSVFDSSVERGEPISFQLGGVIPGWQEGLQLMSVGSKYKFYIPYNLGYGERGSGRIPPYATLVFEVELLEIES